MCLKAGLFGSKVDQTAVFTDEAQSKNFPFLGSKIFYSSSRVKTLLCWIGTS